jgi:V8-like Glu-specific endopeptidase
MTIRSPKTTRRAGRAAAPGIAALLVTALLGLAEPAGAATPATTPSPLPTAAGQTSEAHGVVSHDDDDDRDKKKKKKKKEKKEKHGEHESPEDESQQDEPREDERDRDRVLPAVGQLQSESNLCSGTVIGSTSRQLVLTAAHCVYIPEKSTPAGGLELNFGDKEPGPINEELTFVPGLAADEEPYGRWSVEDVFVSDQWKETGDPRFDVAVLRIAKQDDGKAIQDVVEPQGVDFRVEEQSMLSLYGYPVEGRFNDGTTNQESCIDRGDITLNGIYSMKPCDLTKGSGGGPWIARFNEYDSAIVAVTVAPSNDGTGLLGAPLGDNARELYDAADSAGENQ